MVGLVKTLVILGLAAVILFDLGAIVVNRIQVDAAALEAARISADALREGGGARQAGEAATRSLVGHRGMAVILGASQAGTPTVTVTRRAGVILLGRLSAFDGLVETSVTKAVRPAG